jgi:iron complex outermembrane receptor protein
MHAFSTRRAPGFSLRQRSTLAQAAFLCLLGTAAWAQQSEAPPPQLEKVTITGSSIKRIAAETALPVQVIKREDIDKSGVTTAAELLKNISANTAPLSDGASITDGTSGQRGFNGANLRGLGVSSTLVLLNGRRLANFASPGDNAGVDLNNIPAGAIQRVEVLKDGASAIYGTDAIGGVVNFITRKDYDGLDFNAYTASTQEGGAGKRTASLSAGWGRLDTDRFNVMASLDLQQLDALRSSQRQFIQDRPLASNLPALMSSNTYPANIDISSTQRNALITAGVLPAGSTRTRVNPANPKCNTLTDATVFAATGPGGPLACSYDYMKDTEIYPESRRVGGVGRATLQLSDDHQLYLEGVLARAESKYVLSPNPIRIRNLPVSLLPEPYRSVLNKPGLPTTFSGIRYRMTEAGNRTSEVTSEARRWVLGSSGLVAGWDYDVGLTRAENTAVDRYINGYVLFDKFDAAVRAGTVNPWGASSQAGRDLIESIKINDAARSSKGVSTSFDGKVSKALMTLDGGDLALALGGEYRLENTQFTPSALLLSNNIAGDRDSGVAAGSTTALKATRDTRKVASAYAEINAPFTKALELQLALRYDRYSQVGATTNPKIGIRWQPSRQLLLRGSAGTGFRAPSLSDLNRPVTYGVASSFLTDPQCAAKDGIDLCTDQWPVERRANPNLKPEKSSQFSFGVLFEPSRNSSVGVDYWNIRKTDVISTLGEQIIVNSPAKYNGKYIQRDSSGYITNILLVKENQGVLKTSGLDFNADWRGARGDWGRPVLGYSGTLVLNYDRQFGPQEPYRSNLGVFLNDQVIQRWRHRASLGWDVQDLSLTLSNQYSSSYRDQNTTYDPTSNQLLPERNVAAYSLWDLTGSYSFSKALKVRAGVLNVLNTAPPYSNQAYYFLAGYDPTYTDPRGRSFFASVNYRFK